MRTAHKFTVVVVASLVLAAIVLAPGRQEYVAMLASEGRHKEAIAILEHQLADAPQAPDLLAALGRSYAALGETDLAIKTVAIYLELRPDDVLARERQARLLLQSGQVDRYLDAMMLVTAARPSPARVANLVELLRLHGKFEEEIATLRAYADRDMLDISQLERLGAALAEGGRWVEARQALEMAERKSAPDSSAGRLLLLDVLIQGNEVESAYDHALAWMTMWRSPYLSGRLIQRLAQSELSVPASRLSVKFAEMMPDNVFDIAGLLAGEGHPYIAHVLLRQWAEQVAKPTESQLRAFIHASASIGDVSGPLVKLTQLVRRGAEPTTLAMIAEELADAFGPSALAAIRPLLSNKVLLTRPMFAAKLSLLEGNREMARWFLNRVDPSRFAPDASENWLALLSSVESEAEVYTRLVILWKDGRLPADLVPHLATQALKLGHVGTHDLIWQSVARQQADRQQPTARRIR
jgi:tetratricopeptide (TPR) repeat protein